MRTSRSTRRLLLGVPQVSKDRPTYPYQTYIPIGARIRGMTVLISNEGVKVRAPARNTKTRTNAPISSAYLDTESTAYGDCCDTHPPARSGDREPAPGNPSHCATPLLTRGVHPRIIPIFSSLPAAHLRHAHQAFRTPGAAIEDSPMPGTRSSRASIRSRSTTMSTAWLAGIRAISGLLRVAGPGLEPGTP